LKVLKERESLIIDYFYKCFSFKNTTGSMRSTGFGTPGQLQDDMLFTLFDAMKDQTASLSRYHMRQKQSQNFRESQLRVTIKSLLKIVKDFKNKELEDKLFEQ
jgi:hypothetical protein